MDGGLLCPQTPCGHARSSVIEINTSAMQNSSVAQLTLRLTTVQASTGLLRDWCIRGPRLVTWSQVATALGAPDVVYVGSMRLSPEAVLGTAPLVNFAVVSDVREEEAPAHLLDLVAIEGPCVGARAPLTRHAMSVGRGAMNHLNLRDSDLSRLHCEVLIEHGRAVVRDCNSTNGTSIDAIAVSNHFTELRMGQRLRIGGSTLTLQKPARVPEETPTDETGRYLVYRSPRTLLHLPDVTLVEPAPPTAPRRRGFPWAAATVPLVLAAAMVAVLHNPIFAVFALLSPVMVVAQYVGDRGSSRGRQHADECAHTVAVTAFEHDCATALRVEQNLRRRMAPPITRASHDVVFRAASVWQRGPGHPDYLSVRLGIGSLPSTVKVGTGTGVPRPLEVDEVPITFSLDQPRVVGLSGPHRRAMTLGVLIQVAAWHSPVDLRMAIVCSDRHAQQHWSTMGALPHLLAEPASAPQIVVADAEDEAFLRWCAQFATPVESEPPHSLLILDGPVTDVAAVSDLVQHASSYGLAVLALHEQHSRLPAGCATTVRVERADLAYLDDLAFRPDLAIAQLASATARSLACLVDAGASAALRRVPDRVNYADLVRSEMGLELDDADAVQRLWAVPHISLRALLGEGTDGPVWVDLASDGPHALVAGTTGSGKSELLQTLIASLALTNPPSRLSFVLVDYKGGAAFQECARLPHTLGLVTDLDAHLTTRALRSLEAEVRRRERLLASVGASDIAAFDRSCQPSPLARLCIVIDEFRVLSQELPQFIDGLVRIAAVGRSLGIHLILATQRPAGVVSPDMRANINLRIALRVRDVSDSHDVIETGAAASIPATLPGRAIVRTGGGKPYVLQTAWTGAPPSTGTRPIEVARVDPLSGEPVWPKSSSTAQLPGLKVLLETISAAARTHPGPAPKSPWLPPLRSVLRPTQPSAAVLRNLALRAPTPEAIALGQIDLPDDQEQVGIGWDPVSDGHLAIVGGPRSGRTTVARSAAQSAAALWDNNGMHLYVLDGSGSLGELGSLPHCGGLILRDELSRTLRLVNWLTTMIAQRQLRCGSAGFQTPSDNVGTRSADLDPRILLIIDGWEIFQELSSEHTVGELEDRIGQVLRDGAAVGVSVLATGGRSLLSGRVNALFSSTVALRMADPSDLLMVGLRSAQIPTVMPPGRGLLLPGGQELQFALSGAPLETPKIAIPAGRTRSYAGAGAPVLIGALPYAITLAELANVDTGSVPIGATVDGTASLPLGERGDAGWLICGPSRSGRSTALASLAIALPTERPVAWISANSPQIALPTDLVRLDHDDFRAVAGWCEQHPDGAILIDDLDQLTGMPAEPALLEHLAHSRSTGAVLCASGNASDLANTFRGVAPELRRRQTGVLLQPGRHDGDVFGVRIGPMDRPRPGRGLLVVRGVLTEMQVATP